MSKYTRPGQKIKLKSVEELLGVVNEESAMDIEIEKIRPFKDHPFKVLDDEKMQDLVESIRANGILSPVLIRPVGNDRYEMVSGHRRMHAAQVLGLERIPAIIRDMTDNEATVKMVDSNIQREELLPSEKAYAYKMKMDALRRQAGRPTKENPRQIVGNYETADVVGRENGESGRQVQRYIRLTELLPELLDLVDKKRLQFTVAVEISYIDPEVQKWIYEYIRENGQIKLNQIMIIIFVIAGLFLLIPVMLFLTLYAENILFLDSLILSVITAFRIRSIAGIHPVFCILTGVAVLAGMMLLYSQRCMFWIFTAVSSMLWGYMVSYILHDITNDWIWGIFLGLAAGTISMVFHVGARARYYG